LFEICCLIIQLCLEPKKKRDAKEHAKKSDKPELKAQPAQPTQPAQPKQHTKTQKSAPKRVKTEAGSVKPRLTRTLNKQPQHDEVKSSDSAKHKQSNPKAADKVSASIEQNQPGSTDKVAQSTRKGSSKGRLARDAKPAVEAGAPARPSSKTKAAKATRDEQQPADTKHKAKVITLTSWAGA
jgi:hypothetical protein